MCVLLPFSTDFVWNFYHSKKNWVRCDKHVYSVYVKYSLFLSDFNETWIFLTDFLKILKYQISWQSIHWEQSCERDGQTDTMKLIVTFGNFVNTPQKSAMFVMNCLVNFYEIWHRSSLQEVVKCDFLENRLCLSCGRTVQMDCCSHFPHFMADLHEFSVGYHLHVMMLSSCVCCENGSNESHTLLMSLL